MLQVPELALKGLPACCLKLGWRYLIGTILRDGGRDGYRISLRIHEYNRFQAGP
jgi:hypothetical protein